uniref:Protein FAR1-RELATED SEQUENCE n=1 Tax=Lactuca sativa TaxID=4236 RepID=A0A9R1XMF9_LACSA|nr:hypothetical protein LSAT_V11C300110010 [Lactuca sativa]
MDVHTEDGDYNDDLYSMQDGIDHTFGDSMFDDQHHGIDKNPIEDCYIYDFIDLDANVLGDISIEDETLGVFDDNQSNDNHQSSNHEHIPNVPDEVKPKLKGHYRSYEDITDMYYKYALAAGFDVRKMTNRKNGHGIIRLRYLVCSRKGLPNTGHVDTLNPNRKEHNHELMSQDNILFSRHRRQLNSWQKSCIISLTNQNVGATQAHMIFTALNGGYNIIRGTVDDFKNLMRDLNCFIVDKMTNRTKNVPNFSFAFRVENKQLNAMFWADETSKINYKEFGDVVSFDATFRTNSKEDINSYTWLLKSFLKAFGKQPILVLSDEDPAMKNAIANVSLDIVNDEEFKLLFNSLIWNSKLGEKDFCDIPKISARKDRFSFMLLNIFRVNPFDLKELRNLFPKQNMIK